MTNKDLLNAMDGLDARLVINAAPGEKLKRSKSAWIRWSSLAACFCLILSVVLIIALGKPFASVPLDSNESADGGIQIPDKVYTFEINEKMSCVCGECYIIFDNLYLTDSINSEIATEGGYLIFVARVSTDHHRILAGNVTLDAEAFNSNEYTFNEALSESLSDTKNTFEPDTTVLNGKISFVFTLDESAYNEISTAIENAPSVDKLTLSPDIAWHGGLCLFDFRIDDIERIANYN